MFWAHFVVSLLRTLTVLKVHLNVKNSTKGIDGDFLSIWSSESTYMAILVCLEPGLKKREREIDKNLTLDIGHLVKVSLLFIHNYTRKF